MDISESRFVFIVSQYNSLFEQGYQSTLKIRANPYIEEPEDLLPDPLPEP